MAEGIEKSLDNYERNFRIYTLYVDGNVPVFAIAEKFKLTVPFVYSVIHAFSKEHIALSKKLFDKDFVKTTSVDRIRMYKQQIRSIIKILKNAQQFNLLQKYYAELRKFEELELKTQGVIKDSGGPAGRGVSNVFLINNIRGKEGEKKAEGEIVAETEAKIIAPLDGIQQSPLSADEIEGLPSGDDDFE